MFQRGQEEEDEALRARQATDEMELHCSAVYPIFEKAGVPLRVAEVVSASATKRYFVMLFNAF
jgi:hypothetical protein